MTKWGNTGSFGNIRWVDSDLLIGRRGIEYTEDSRALGVVNQTVSVWNGKVVPDGFLVQSSVINANP